MTEGGGSPRVSVYMPVYNGAAYLAECLDSILDQSFRDFEVVAVDDGSKDGSLDILSQYADRDDRIRVLRHKVNQGHHQTSNDALAACRGAYLARMDQDDLWLRRRLEASVHHLDAHPEVGLLSTAYVRFRPDGHRSERRPPRPHTKVRAQQAFGNLICHPSVTLRADLARTGELHYRDLPGPQDYDLWSRLLPHTQAHTLSEPLVLYREHDSSMTDLFRDDLPKAAEAVSNRQLRGLLGEDVDDDTLRTVRRLWSRRGPRDGADYAKTRLVFEAFAAMERWPHASRDDVRDMRRKWCRRALTAAMRNRQMRAATPLVTEIARHEPTAMAYWFAGDLPRRSASALRQRRVRPARLATVE
jgi:glycosyltransferase involved in cell wall biosynthesis